MAAKRQSNRVEKLKKIHETQSNDLQKYIQTVSSITLEVLLHFYT